VHGPLIGEVGIMAFDAYAGLPLVSLVICDI
jgi:hypothetical protein